jgi:DNA modification methylase
MTELHPESVGCCITSPPYLNNFDFAEMTRMQLYLLGWCRNWKEISQQVRNNLITNTTTALSGKKGTEYQNMAHSSIPQILHSELDSIVQELARERSTRAGKKEYDYLVYPYYSQITQVLNGIFRALRPGATIHWVVADAALYGVHIETHEHTASIMRELGFRDVAIHLLRKRGERWILSKRDGTPKGLGEYHIEAKK